MDRRGNWTRLANGLTLSLALGCASHGRSTDAAPMDAHTGGPEWAGGDAEATRPPIAAGVWRPTDPPAAIEPWGFRISLYNGDGAVGAFLEIDEAGRFYNYVAGGPRPTESVARFDADFALRDVADGRVYFLLRASDGALVDPSDTGYVAQDLHCHLTEGAELRCHHDEGNGGLDYALTIHGDHIVGRAVGAEAGEGGWQEMNAVAPAPRDDDQRRRVLFIWASYLIPTDTGSHDGDAGFFDGPPY